MDAGDGVSERCCSGARAGWRCIGLGYRRTPAGRSAVDDVNTIKVPSDHTVFWFETKKPHIGVFDRHILWFKVKNVIKCLRNLEKKDDTLLTVLIEFNRNKK